MEADFSGYVTKYNVKCSDGRVIKPGAFDAFHGEVLPLVYMHQHKDPAMVLGHVALEDRPDGMWGEVFLNDTPNGKLAKSQVAHGDIRKFSIWANDLVERGFEVLHGSLREVSLVLSGANKEANIIEINPALAHSDNGNYEGGEAIFLIGDIISHSDGDDNDTQEEEDMAEKTVKEIFETLNDEQRQAVEYVVGTIAENLVDETDDEEDEDDDSAVQHDNLGGENMSRNVFEQGTEDNRQKKTLSHDAMATILADGKKLGSLKDAVLAHADDYGIQDIESLFPEVRDLYNPPEWIKRDTGWVGPFLSKVRKLPFAKIRTRFADVREEEARAKGYLKGNLKKEEVFTLLKRTTGPATIYKKQKLDRDDIVDITDFDVVAWIMAEMRFMLEEELARAILVGDGRPEMLNGDINPDKIKDPAGSNDGVGIRSVLHDDDFYSETVEVAAVTEETALDFMDNVVRARRRWKGSGTPTFYTTVDVSTTLLLTRDQLGRRYNETIAGVASQMLVDSIVDVEVMEEEAYANVVGIMFNPADYSIGSTKGGELTSFNDFDIDYNQYKYLLETRLSGALTRWKAALVFVLAEAPEPDPEP